MIRWQYLFVMPLLVYLGLFVDRWLKERRQRREEQRGFEVIAPDDDDEPHEED